MPAATQERKRTPRPKGHPDGLPPGKVTGEVVDADDYAINVDERAAAREAGKITIGGQTFYRQRKTWQISRELDGMITKQARATRRAARSAAKIAKLEEEVAGVQDPKTGDWKVEPCDDARFDELEAEIEGLEKQKADAESAVAEASVEILAMLLRDEGGAHPDTGVLKNEVDAEDVIAIARKLAQGGEPAEGPTETTDEDS